jgi:UDP-N-acetylglucosamine enolpyruvyl transferase
MTVVATQTEGTVLIHEKMFESRMFFVDKLIGMGARIVLCDPHRARGLGSRPDYPGRSWSRRTSGRAWPWSSLRSALMARVQSRTSTRSNGDTSG